MSTRWWYDGMMHRPVCRDRDFLKNNWVVGGGAIDMDVDVRTPYE
jgi:hypothetical protein